MSKNKFYTIIIISILLITFMKKIEVKNIEEYEIASGFGIDRIKREGNIIYSAPYSIYNFQSMNKSKPLIRVGYGNTMGQTRENRQMKSAKAYIVGLQKVLIVSEDYAKTGINTFINILFANPKMNDRCSFVVCKGRAVDILKLKVKGYDTSSDYIEGLVNNLKNDNFFSSEYTLLNAYVILSSEGRNLVVPYIEISKDGLKVTGTAIFKKDTMVYKFNNEESRIMNILREDNTVGVLTLTKGKGKFISYFPKIKRKVHCTAEGSRFKFDIDIECKGDILSNEIYKVMDDKAIKSFEEEMAKDLKKRCMLFIDKMQKLYAIDTLNLGVCAAAHYGRDKGIDWNKVVTDSDIKVNVSVKVDRVGRGEY